MQPINVMNFSIDYGLKLAARTELKKTIAAIDKYNANIILRITSAPRKEGGVSEKKAKIMQFVFMKQS